MYPSPNHSSPVESPAEKMLPADIEAIFPSLSRLNSTTCWLFCDILGSLWPFFTRIPVPGDKYYRKLVPNVSRSSNFPDWSPLARLQFHRGRVPLTLTREMSHWLSHWLSPFPVCLSFLLTVPVRRDLFPLPIQIWSVSPVIGLKEIVEIKILRLFLLH